MNDMNDDILRAIDLALDDRWDEAHEIAQRYESDATAQWLHAVLHKIEGDLSNSRYWYRQAGRLDWADKEPLEELRSIRATLTG
jgi:hypothetical protein